MKRRDFLKTSIAIAASSGCAGRKKVPTRSMGLEGKVYEPITIKKIIIPNRIVSPAITNRYADEQGFVTEKLINFHRNIAKGGAGLSIIGATAVRKDGILI